MYFHPVVVIGLGKNLLFKSVLGHSEPFANSWWKFFPDKSLEKPDNLLRPSMAKVNLNKTEKTRPKLPQHESSGPPREARQPRLGPWLDYEKQKTAAAAVVRR